MIVHLAAAPACARRLTIRCGYQEINVAGTQNLLELARTRGIRQFVFASSSSVYGVNPRVPWREDDHVLQPISPYASTKVSGELLGHVYAHLYGIRFLALRFFTVYGPRQRPDLAIHKFARLILDGQPDPVLRRRLDAPRLHLHRRHRRRACAAAMEYEHDAVRGHQSRQRPRPCSLHGDGAGARAGARSAARTVERLPEQPGDVPQTWANIEKARRLLGYRPETSLLEGVQRFAEWMTSVAARS